MLLENSGDIYLTIAWVYYLLKRMGFVQQKASTNTKRVLTKAEFEAVKSVYLQKIRRTARNGRIPAELTISWDQIGVNIHVVPVSQRTQGEQGSLRVET